MQRPNSTTAQGDHVHVITAHLPTSQITVDGVERSIGAGTTGTELFESSLKDGVVAMRVNGEPWDLDRRIPAGAVVEPIALDSQDGLNILRHSATHVMAQAVQEIFPEVDLGIGPFITDGFYYDFGGIDAVTPELMREIEKRMKRIVKEGQRFRRREISEAEAAGELADQPYKLELVTTKGAGAEGASVEVGSGGLTMYDNVRRDGTVAWTDLCRGPHLPSTRHIGQGFALTKSSRARAPATTPPRVRRSRWGPASSPSTTTSAATVRWRGATCAAARTCPPPSGSLPSS